jgi:hypothetical protein
MIKSRMRVAGHIERMVEMRNSYKILIRSPEGKGQLERMDFREIRWEGADWTHLAQDRDQWRALVNTEMSLRFP